MNLNKKIINNFFNIINFKKLNQKMLQNINKNISKNSLFKNYNNSNYYFVKFIINISTSKSNIFLHIMNCLGHQQYFFSIAILKKANNKKILTNNQILEKFYKILLIKFKFLQDIPIVIHFNGTELNFQWFIEKISKKFFIIVTKFYSKYSHNGCRRKKMKRKKIKKSKF